MVLCIWYNLPMDFIKNFTPTPLNVLKAIGMVFVGLFIIIFAFDLLGNSFGGMMGGMKLRPVGSMGGTISVAPVAPEFSYGTTGYDSSEGSDYYTKSMSGVVATQGAAYGRGGVMMSSRNVSSTIAPYPPYGGGSVGNGEEFEVTDYSANIETRNKQRDCSAVLALKSLDYVVFENNNESETYCSYTFKVKHANVPEIIAKIKALNPKDFNENSYTIKKQIDDFTSETELIENKINSINKSLESAIRAYDSITSLATQTQNVDTLAKIIDSKLQTIQRLTNESINANAELERLTRAKEEQLDKVDYSYFYVSVYENKFVDWRNIKESWKGAIRNFFYNINNAVQDATINVLLFIFTLIPYLIYLFILIIVAKYSWRVGKNIWKR
jgi:hypothetical protein